MKNFYSLCLLLVLISCTKNPEQPDFTIASLEECSLSDDVFLQTLVVSVTGSESLTDPISNEKIVKVFGKIEEIVKEPDGYDVQSPGFFERAAEITRYGEECDYRRALIADYLLSLAKQ